MTIVGRTPCRIAPRMLKTSPANHTTINTIDSPSAEPLRKFSMIWGENTTTQQAIEIEPQMPESASMSSEMPCCGGNMMDDDQRAKCNNPAQCQCYAGFRGKRSKETWSWATTAWRCEGRREIGRATTVRERMTLEVRRNL